MKLNYGTDILMEYADLFRAAYEKANIWPIEDAEQGVCILHEEVQEAYADADEIFILMANLDVMIDDYLVDKIKAMAVSTILELLQVIAVCNKYAPVWEVYEPEEGDDLKKVVVEKIATTTQHGAREEAKEDDNEIM